MDNQKPLPLSDSHSEVRLLAHDLVRLQFQVLANLQNVAASIHRVAPKVTALKAIVDALAAAEQFRVANRKFKLAMEANAELAATNLAAVAPISSWPEFQAYRAAAIECQRLFAVAKRLMEPFRT